MFDGSNNDLFTDVEIHRYRPYFVHLSVFVLLTDESYRCTVHEENVAFFLSFSLLGEILHFDFQGSISGRNVSFSQEFKLCMISILIQHDEKIRKLAKTLYVCTFYGFLRSAQLIGHNYMP